MIEKTRILPLLDNGLFILDGAMGTSIQVLELPPGGFDGKEGCNEYLNLVRPEIIESIHKSFLEVGCMGVETNTFGGSRLKLAEYGLQERTLEINQRGAEIARTAADSFPDGRYVFGSIGPTGMLPSTNDPVLGRIKYDELIEVFTEQAIGLINGGVDVLLIETAQDILEVKAAIAGCNEAMAGAERMVPVVAQVTLDANGRMLLGTDIGSALVTLEGMGVDAVGINCSTGPKEMRDSIRFLSQHSTVPISCLPNMGIPKNVGGRPVYPLAPAEFAALMTEFVRSFGVNVVGGCCGSTPRHLRALVESLSNVRPHERTVEKLHAVSSAFTHVSVHQTPTPLIVGERVNAQGSRKMKQLLLEGNLEGIAELARDQAEKGAHALDVCVALNELENEPERFTRVAKELALRVAAPIFIDSTDSQTIREGIKNYPGRVVVNSVNLESGEKRIDEVGETIRRYGAYVIALTIDEEGMARTRERKVRIAKRIATILGEKHGIEPERIIFDPLTFTLATGEEIYRSSAVDTLEAIAEIKREIPGSLTILGVSNVSFGLSRPARAVLNSVFLYHALQKGLDMAIVNPADITPYSEIPEESRTLAEALIFDRHKSALDEFIACFEKVREKPGRKIEVSFESPEEEIHYKILNRYPDGIEKLIETTIEKRDAVEVLNEVLLPAMKEVGDRFGRGELILPFVLQSAEVMKRAVGHLEKYLEKREGYHKGRVVLATVYGDVHDIGKNLVKTILSNNGYDVLDLGKQVPVQRILEQARNFEADAVGLSALLVSTSRQMPIVVRELYRAGIHLPVLVGGAAVTPRFARASAVLDESEIYPGGLFYAKDAFEGLRIMDALSSKDSRKKVLERYRREIERVIEREDSGAGRSRGIPGVARAQVEAIDPPEPPFWGIRKLTDIDLEKVYQCMDLRSLYRLSWGIRHLEKEEYERLIAEKFEPLRLELQEEAREKGYLIPEAVYGYFPCRAQGEELVLYSPKDMKQAIASMHFPRQKGKKGLSLVDYFRRDRIDVVPLQIVTVGPKASAVCESLNNAGQYSKSYFLHGLSVEAAEGLAEFVHRHIRAELGIATDRGLRYSHGYPACPDLRDNRIFVELLEARQLLGVSLTNAHQFVPEQTTAALVVHHPAAEYFSV